MVEIKSLNKKVVVFIMGATATGKSKLSVSLAISVGGEIVNCDKIHVYKGLDVMTNKIPKSEMMGVPHHLIGHVDPDEEYTARDFCSEAIPVIDKIISSGKVPIVIGCSHSFIEALVEDPNSKFKSNYECYFIWVDVATPVLNTVVCKRVDQMVKEGLVDEAREMFAPEKDYTKGIRKAIGITELDKYLKTESNDQISSDEKQKLLESGIADIKANTISLIVRQLERIRRLKEELGWRIHRIDSTAVFEIDDKKAQEAAWLKMVYQPSLNVVLQYLKN